VGYTVSFTWQILPVPQARRWRKKTLAVKSQSLTQLCGKVANLVLQGLYEQRAKVISIVEHEITISNNVVLMNPIHPELEPLMSQKKRYSKLRPTIIIYKVSTFHSAIDGNIWLAKFRKPILSRYYQISQICIISFKGEKFKSKFMSIFNGIFLCTSSENFFFFRTPCKISALTDK
jgi:hypothetical protein